MAVVVDVGEESAGGVFHEAKAGVFGDVLECAIATVAVETVGKSSGLADVEVVEAVAGDVAYGEAVVTVDIDAASDIEDAAPVVDAALELGRVGGIAAECCGGDVGVGWVGAAASCFFQRLPPEYQELSGSALPFQIPFADALLAMEAGASANEFVMHAGLHSRGKFVWWSWRGVDSGDLEFGSENLRESA